MDPQHRLLLENTVEVIESNGASPTENTAVMVGVASGDYTEQIKIAKLSLSNYTAIGTASSVAAGR